MFHVNALSSFCLYFDSRRIHELGFLLQLACSSLTPRCFNDVSMTLSIQNFLFLIYRVERF